MSKWTMQDVGGRECMILKDEAFFSTAVKRNAQELVTGMNELEELRQALIKITEIKNVFSSPNMPLREATKIAREALSKPANNK